MVEGARVRRHPSRQIAGATPLIGGPLFLIGSVGVHFAAWAWVAGLPVVSAVQSLVEDQVAFAIVDERDPGLGTESEPTPAPAEVKAATRPRAKPIPPPPVRPRPRPPVARTLHAAASSAPEPDAVDVAPPSRSSTAAPSEAGSPSAGVVGGVAPPTGPLGMGGAGSGTGRSIDPRLLVRDWVARVNRAIAVRAGRDYPLAARRARLQGTVVVSIEVNPRGRIAGVKVAQASGHERLDRAAIAAVMAVDVLPPPPDLFARAGRPLVMPIRYRLR